MKTRNLSWLSLVGVAAVAGFVDTASAVIVPINGVNGRFIRVTNTNGVQRQLAIGELEVFGFGVTPNTPANLSSNDIAASFETEGATSGFAIDHGANTNTTNNVRDTGGNTYQRSGVGTFHIIDLGATQNVGSVRLWQRNDGCCQDRLSNFTVSVLADNAGVPGATLFTSDNFVGQVATNSFTQVNTVGAVNIQTAGNGTIGTEVVGDNTVRFIRVRHNANGQLLGIGEIEAFAAGVTPSAASGLSTNEITGLSFESQVAPNGIAHGGNTAPFNNTLDSGAAVYTFNAAGAVHAPNEYIVDLNTSTDLGQLRLFNRVDCCQERLANYTVALLGDNGAGLPGKELFSQSVPGQTPNTPAFTQINVGAIADAFTIGSADVLTLEIDPANFTADLLKIGGLGTGALTIQPGAALVINLLSPAGASATFNVLDFGSVAGTFSSITFNGNGTLDTSRLYTTGEVSVLLPEPVTATLGMMGLAALAVRTGRRQRA